MKQFLISWSDSVVDQFFISYLQHGTFLPKKKKVYLKMFITYVYPYYLQGNVSNCKNIKQIPVRKTSLDRRVQVQGTAFCRQWNLQKNVLSKKSWGGRFTPPFLTLNSTEFNGLNSKATLSKIKGHRIGHKNLLVVNTEVVETSYILAKFSV